LPLHTKSVRTTSLSKKLAQLQAIDATCGTDFARPFKEITDALENNKSSILMDTGPSLTMELNEADINTLQAAGLIHPANDSAPRNTRVFSVAESSKGRRRWISHTPSTNEVISTEDLVQWKSPPDMIDNVRLKYAICIDFKAYFHQFGLDEQLWTFEDEKGQRWSLTTIPTGANFCPALAQLFSCGLVALLVRRFPHLAVDVYLDNIRLLASEIEYLQEATKEFFRIAESHDTDINEQLEECLQNNFTHYEFLGIAFDHSNQSVSLSEKTKAKLIALTIPEQSTVREYLRAYGLLGFCSLIMGISRAEFYYATKFLRRKVGKQLDSQVHIWRCASNDMNRWKAKLVSSPPRIATLRGPQTATVFTDASDYGYGGVLFTDLGHVAIVAGRFADMELRFHINVKEARALYYVLSRFRLDDIGQLHIKVDNTSLLYTAAKGDSRSYLLSQEILRIWSLENWKRVVSIAYVDSASNRADLPSRLCPMLPLLLQQNLPNPLLWKQFERHFDNSADQ
jgi:hypothetical protein